MFSFFKKKEKTEEQGPLCVRACVSGRVIPVEEVGDGVFSSKALGDGIAIEPEEETIIAPCGGVVSVIMEDSRHAVGLTLDNGAELLIHEGLDTVEMNGDGFQMFVKVGDRVKTGDKLLKFDAQKITERGLKKTCIVILTGTDGCPDVKFETGMDAKQGETVVMRFA